MTGSPAEIAKLQQDETERPGGRSALRPARSGHGQLSVYYDGSCPLCTAEIRHYASRPGAAGLSFVDVSCVGSNPGPNLPAEKAMARFHVRRPDGRLLSGACAFVEIWNVLPGWRWAARIARLPGVLVLLEGAYRAFLPIRPALSRLATRFGAEAASPGGMDR